MSQTQDSNPSWWPKYEAPLWTKEEDEIILAKLKEGLSRKDITQCLAAAGFLRSKNAVGRRMPLLREAGRPLAWRQDDQHFSEGVRWSSASKKLQLRMTDKKLAHAIYQRYKLFGTNRIKAAEQMLLYIGLRSLEEKVGPNITREQLVGAFCEALAQDALTMVELKSNESDE